MVIRNLMVATCLAAISLLSCQPDNAGPQNTIYVSTNHQAYKTGEKVNISITNMTEGTAKHFSCDQVDLRASRALIFKNDEWVEERLGHSCTAMGPMGIWGKLESGQTKKDSQLFKQEGHYKLRYTFLVDSDTVHFESKPFTVFN